MELGPGTVHRFVEARIGHLIAARLEGDHDNTVRIAKVFAQTPAAFRPGFGVVEDGQDIFGFVVGLDVHVLRRQPQLRK